MWNQEQYQYFMGGQQPYQYYGPPPPQIQIPPQVLVAFRLLGSLDDKQIPIVAINNISTEVVERRELLPIEEKARATALEVLIAFMRSVLE